jgi:hypothetical protein
MQLRRIIADATNSELLIPLLISVWGIPESFDSGGTPRRVDDRSARHERSPSARLKLAGWRIFSCHRCRKVLCSDSLRMSRVIPLALTKEGSEAFSPTRDLLLVCV